MAKNLKTYAPESAYKKTEEFIRPTHGSGVEIAVAWNERVIGDHHFHRSGGVSVGAHPSCDIQLPLIHSFAERIELIRIDHGISVNIPAGVKVELVRLDDQGIMQAQPVDSTQANLYLQQKEMLYIYLSDSLKLIVRPSQQSINPKVIPFIDVSSDGFLSLALAVAISAIIALLVQMNPSQGPISLDDDVYQPALILQNPQRIAKILNLPPPKKIDMTKPRKPKPKTPGPKLLKPSTAKTQSRIKKNPGNKTKPSSLAKNRNKTPNKVGSKFDAGKSIKTAKKSDAQAKSPNLSQSGIFSAFGSNGRRNQVDKDYEGGGALAGLAKNFNGKSGEGANHEGDRFGDRFKKASSNSSGRNNVGVEGLQGSNGLGPGFGNQSLGNKKSVSVIPYGSGATFGGEIDREGIRKVFFDNSRALRSCYERSLNKNGRLGGTLTLDFDIGENGRVVGRPKVNRDQSSFYNASMAECITNRLQTWRFPHPPRNNVVNVLYPLAFSAK